MMSPFSGRFTSSSLPSLQAGLRLYPTTTMPFGTAAISQMIGGGVGLRVLRGAFCAIETDGSKQTSTHNSRRLISCDIGFSSQGNSDE
jgi:hypothetical protein